MTEIKGHIVDLKSRRTFSGCVNINDGHILSISELPGDSVPDQTILPGLIDSHVHIESSMLVPSEFARIAVRHGTVATVSDPHEIANVCGVDGVEFMIRNGSEVPFKFFFGAPSCVPATPFETAGAELDLEAVCRLLDRDEILYLAEMMNWPGVLGKDPQVMGKIQAALDRGKPVDGHAPGLKGSEAERYISAGITTDHECFTQEEAVSKLRLGMKIAIREGSAARNFKELLPLLTDWAGRIMFCSDDKHPDDLLDGHINKLIARGLSQGYDFYDLLAACSQTPAEHYGLPVGLLQPGDPADLIVVKNLRTMIPVQTWIDGVCLFDGERVRMPSPKVTPINNFISRTLRAEEFLLPGTGNEVPVIVAIDGEIVTGAEMEALPVVNGMVQPDLKRDILKIAVVNRYAKTPPAVGFIRNFGLREGAIASSVAHDSHNIISVGCNDQAICRVVNRIMEQQGGIAAVNDIREEVLPLPVAGIMSDRSGEDVAKGYERLNEMARKMGSNLQAPFMLLSFMALLVIPSFKISDKGMFDGNRFTFLS